MSNSSMSVSLVAYFALNLFVTLTNKRILSNQLGGWYQRPYLLTTAHATATCINCYITRRFYSRDRIRRGPERILPPRESVSLTWSQHVGLAAFSLFYTINIALSNLSLALINLSLHQTIRATAPLLTVLVSVLFMGEHIRSYCASTYLSLVLITAGVAIATQGVPLLSKTRGVDGGTNGTVPYNGTQHITGILITLLGALTAVLKTILTHKLMTSMSLSISSPDLLQILSPYAAIQALVFAYFNQEIRHPIFELKSTSVTTPNYTRKPDENNVSLVRPKHTGKLGTFYTGTFALWIVNPAAASLLNIASFEANKRCGPVSMAVAANLKQVVILALPLLPVCFGSTIVEQEISFNLVIGTLLTVTGGIWYACSISKKDIRKKDIHLEARLPQVFEEKLGSIHNS